METLQRGADTQGSRHTVSATGRDRCTILLGPVMQNKRFTTIWIFPLQRLLNDGTL